MKVKITRRDLLEELKNPKVKALLLLLAYFILTESTFLIYLIYQKASFLRFFAVLGGWACAYSITLIGLDISIAMTRKVIFDENKLKNAAYLSYIWASCFVIVICTQLFFWTKVFFI